MQIAILKILYIDIMSMMSRITRCGQLHRKYQSMRSFQILPRILLAVKESNSGTIIEWYHKMVNDNKALREYFAFGALIDEFQYYRPMINA